MSKLLFIPFSVIGGIVAGIVGKKTFQALWGLVTITRLQIQSTATSP